MRNLIVYLSASILLLFIIPGCSGNYLISPGIDRFEGSNLTIPNDADRQISSSGFLGLYHIDVQTVDLTWSIEPFRNACSVDVLETVDITGFMTSSPCRDCVRIFNLGLNASNHLVMGLGIKHPFPTGDPSKEITGRNRADLHVFNIEGTILTDQPKLINFPSHGFDLATGYLVNPDGYTTYLDSFFDNIVPTQSEGHPYILHFDDYSQGNFDDSNPNGFADILNPTGNLVMKMGSDYSIKNYEFAIPIGENLSFDFAVGCTFGFTTMSYLDRFNPVYLMPQHNKKAASEVHVMVTENNLKQKNSSSYARLRIEVMDINHNASVGSAKNEMAHESKVGLISVNVPFVDDEVQLVNPTPLSGDGRNTPLIYEVTVYNHKDAKGGIFSCLVKIKDSYPTRANPNPLLGSADAMGRLDATQMALQYLFEFATYQITELEVQPCDFVSLRGNATPLDIGVDGAGNSLIAYSDKQVWKYDDDFCSAEHLYTVESGYLPGITRIDAHSDGRTIVTGPGPG